MTGNSDSRTAETEATAGKRLVRRLIDDVMNAARLSVIEELYTSEMTLVARRWIEPFLVAFPDARMEIVNLVAERDVVVGHFRCSGTHLGTWRGHPPTGRRFHGIDEIYFFTIRNDRIAAAWGLEDNDRRKRQLGL